MTSLSDDILTVRKAIDTLTSDHGVLRNDAQWAILRIEKAIDRLRSGRPGPPTMWPIA